jgi:hypothetical protein
VHEPPRVPPYEGGELGKEPPRVPPYEGGELGKEPPLAPPYEGVDTGVVVEVISYTFLKHLKHLKKHSKHRISDGLNFRMPF